MIAEWQAFNPRFLDADGRMDSCPMAVFRKGQRFFKSYT